MDEPIKQNTEMPESKFSGIPCQVCNRETRHKVLSETSLQWGFADGMVDVWTTHEILQCQGCLSITYVESSACSEDINYGADGEPYLPKTTKYFPNRIVGRAKLDNLYALPYGVAKIYEEAHDALCSNLPIMSGFGLRAIVEAVCNYKEVKGENLEKKIDGLHSMGLITGDGAKILHSLRFMGNEAAHKMKVHTNAQMSAAFDVIEYLLMGVYILPERADILPKKNQELLNLRDCS